MDESARWILAPGQLTSREPIDFSRWAKHSSVYISSVTVSELLTGVHMAKTQAIKMRRSAFVEYIITKIAAIAFDDTIARIHAELHAHLIKKGKMIDAHDLIIAATAIHSGFPVLTNNVREFERVPGLKLIDAEPVI
ncbi:MAG: VapC toxin family PIN domain ribonuclease [Legionellaceae bacterium]|nr:VapC toxin family PIN domain ribonuclease [Legionellaceae bacterium]|tara:strand:- start:1469 stop:1879 length:411 start_codon:yes stop_codon:yes gene_type:complete